MRRPHCAPRKDLSRESAGIAPTDTPRLPGLATGKVVEAAPLSVATRP